MNRNVIVTGATGLIGTALCRSLIKKNYNVIVFTRDINKAKSEVPFINSFVKWDYMKPEEWMNAVDKSFAVIHLAGANLFSKRWNENYKKLILESREVSTRNIVHSIAEANQKPSVMITSSAVGIYGSRGDEILTESSNPGSGFLSTVCKAWEYEASRVEDYGVRRVSIRTGVILNKHEGALKEMLLPFRLFVGGPLGSGNQWFSWIHLKDIVNIYIYALENNISGPVNGSSPNPVTMNDFAKHLGKVLSRPSIFKVPEFALKIIVGESASSVAASLRVIPEKLNQQNFPFEYPNLIDALHDILSK